MKYDADGYIRLLEGIIEQARRDYILSASQITDKRFKGRKRFQKYNIAEMFLGSYIFFKSSANGAVSIRGQILIDEIDIREGLNSREVMRILREEKLA